MAIEQIGVVGAGVMGSEIAHVAAGAGKRVVLRDVDEAALERGLSHVRSLGQKAVRAGRMSAGDASALLARIDPVTQDAALAECDLVVEAVTERLDVKRDVFTRLDAAVKPEAILASNTSGLSITAIGRETGRPDQVIGLHFFNPASVMRLVEVIRGEDTSEATMEAGQALARELRKVPVPVVECPGFLVNRILVRAMAEAYRHAAEIGASPVTVDASVAVTGPAPMGPFALGDLIGLDTMDHIQRDLRAAYGERFDDAGQLAARVALGKLGLKSGEGFYAGRAPRGSTSDEGREVARRYYLGALTEACMCLDESIAALPDIDLAMRLGTGWKIGPLEWADRTGLRLLVARLEKLQRSAGDRFAPPPALLERAAAGRRFHEGALAGAAA
jgi:3-hydroxyacyl-CoA dehydrogenase